VQERDPLARGVERYVGLEHIEPRDLHIRNWGNVADGTTFTRRFQPGQVLFGKRRAYQHKAAIAEFDGICSGDILVFEAKPEELIPELVPFIVESDGFFAHALRTSAGSLSPRTKWKEIASYRFPLPPKPEQKRIAEILWAADATVEKWQVTLSALLASRTLLFNELVPKPIKGAFVPLGEVSEMQNGRVFPSQNYQRDGIRLLRPGNLGATGYFDWSDDNTKCLPIAFAKSAAAYLIKPGDLVINLTAQSLEDGFMGRVCLAQLGDEALLNQRIGRFFCKDWLLPEYLFRVMQTIEFRKCVESRCEGTKVRHLYWRHISDFPVQVIDKDRQEDVIRAGRQLDAAENAIRKASSDAALIARGLRESLLSRHV
jgi:type I restriction enzyme S subunit